MARFDLAVAFADTAVLERSFSLPRERPAWLEFRRTGIGGSDAAALVGADPNRGWLTIYQSKIGEPRAEDEVWSESAYWGNELEDVVAREFQRRMGFRVYHPAGMLRSMENPFALATLDRVAVDEEGRIPVRPLEVKTRSAFTKFDWVETCEPRVYWQVQHYLMVTGADAAYLAVLVGGQQFRTMVVPRSQVDIDGLLDLESRFWSHVADRRPPDPTPGDRSLLAEPSTGDPVEGTVVDLPEDMVEVLRKHREVLELEKSIAARRAELEDQIKLALGPRESGFLGGRVAVTWKFQTSSRLDTKELRSEAPEIYEKFSRQVVSRVLRSHWTEK